MMSPHPFFFSSSLVLITCGTKMAEEQELWKKHNYPSAEEFALTMQRLEEMDEAERQDDFVLHDKAEAAWKDYSAAKEEDSSIELFGEEDEEEEEALILSQGLFRFFFGGCMGCVPCTTKTGTGFCMGCVPCTTKTGTGFGSFFNFF